MREEALVKSGGLAALSSPRLRTLKRKGFADGRIAHLLGLEESVVRKRRHAYGLHPVYKRVDTCAAEFASHTAYLYSTSEEECEAQPRERRAPFSWAGARSQVCAVVYGARYDGAR